MWLLTAINLVIDSVQWWAIKEHSRCLESSESASVFNINTFRLSNWVICFLSSPLFTFSHNETKTLSRRTSLSAVILQSGEKIWIVFCCSDSREAVQEKLTSISSPRPHRKASEADYEGLSGLFCVFSTCVWNSVIMH